MPECALKHAKDAFSHCFLIFGNIDVLVDVVLFVGVVLFAYVLKVDRG